MGLIKPKKSASLEELTADATATAGDIIKGLTAYVKGELVTGTGNFLNVVTGHIDNSNANDVYAINIPCPAVPKVLYLNATTSLMSSGIMSLIFFKDVNFGGYYYISGSTGSNYTLSDVKTWEYSNGVFTFICRNSGSAYVLTRQYDYTIIC